jgi:hypothetical protein
MLICAERSLQSQLSAIMSATPGPLQSALLADLYALREDIRQYEQQMLGLWRLHRSEVSQAPWIPTHRHYKGGEYRVIDAVARLSALGPDDGKPVVVYQNRKGETFARERQEFLGNLRHEGKAVWRFEALDPDAPDYHQAPQVAPNA